MESIPFAYRLGYIFIVYLFLHRKSCSVFRNVGISTYLRSEGVGIDGQISFALRNATIASLTSRAAERDLPNIQESQNSADTEVVRESPISQSYIC